MSETGLFGKYQLLERIAAGAVADVFQAKSHGVEGFEKVVVIKRIHPALSDRAGFIDAFIESAKKAVMLSHANVVQVFDLGQHDGSYYLAMEHVAGPDLATVLAGPAHERTDPGAPGRPVPPPLAVWVAGEITKGLEHAHRRRDYDYQLLEVVHGGLTPSKVLSSREGEVKLTDFGFGLAVRGLAAERPELRDRHRAHLAPELSDPRAPVDGRADLYGVGAILHHLLYGVPPVPPAPGRPAPPVATHTPDGDELPAPVCRLLERALARDPDDRFPEASALYEALMAAMFSAGWRPNPRTWAQLLAERVAPRTPPAMPAVDAEKDDATLLEEELTAEGILAIFDDTTDPNAGQADATGPREAVGAAAPARPARAAPEGTVPAIPAAVAAAHSPAIPSMPPVPAAAPAPGSAPAPAPGPQAKAAPGSSPSSSRTGTPLPRIGTAVETPSGRQTVTPLVSTTHAVICAVQTASGATPANLPDHAAKWGGRLVALSDLPALVLVDTGSLPHRAMERGIRLALSLAEVATPRPCVGVHMGTVGGRIEGEEVVPDFDDAAVIRAADLARSGLPGDVLVSEAGPTLLPSAFAWSPPFTLPGGKVAHRVGHAETARSVTRRNMPAMTTRRIALADLGEGEAQGPSDEPAEVRRTTPLPRGRRPPSLVAPGREEDLAAILRCLEPVRGGESRVVAIEGPPGSGKTELLRAARKALGRLEMSWFVASLDAPDAAVPFAGVRALIGEVCGFEEDDPAPVRRKKLARLAQLGVGPDDVAAVEAAFALRTAPSRCRRDAIALFSTVLRRIAHGLGEDRPVSLVIEDGEHLDPESLQVLSEVVDRLPGARALLWILTSAEAPAGLLRYEAVRRRLGPLGDEGRRFVARRAAARCGVDSPADALVEAVVSRVGDDPRCVEEAVRLLAEMNALEDPDVWAQLGAGAPGGRADLASLVALRLGLLPARDRAVLEQAAAIGCLFGLTLLSRVAGERRERVQEVTDRSVGAGHLEKAGPGLLSFRSRAVREALYDGMSLLDRAGVHERIAREIEALHHEDRERMLDALARHCALAGDTARALTYLEGIANRFVLERSPAAALGPLQEAARLLSGDAEADPERRVELLLRLGDLARTAMRFADARDALQAGLQLAEDGRRERAIARCLLGLGKVDLAEGRFHAASDLLGRALKLADGLRDRALVGEVYGTLGETWQKNGDLVRAVDFLGKAVRIAEEAGDAGRLALLLPLLANAAGGAGDTASAERFIVRALRAVEETGDALSRIKVLKAYSLLDYFAGRFDAGLAKSTEALALAEDEGAVEDAAVLAHNAGDMCMQLGDPHRAYRFFTQSLELCRTHGLSRTELTNEIHLAWLDALVQGRPPTAEAAAAAEPRLRELRRRADELGLKWEALQATWFIAQCLVARGQPGPAKALFEAVRAGARRIHLAFLERDADAAIQALPS